MTTEEHVEATIENLLREEREFPPAPGFVQNALLKDPHIYDHAAPEEGFRAFWTEEGNRLEWMEPWTDLYTWEVPYTKWFIGGKLNVSVNCLDRHVRAGIGDRIAYYWEGEPGDTRTLTYQELLDDVCRFTNALRALGVKKGDRIAIYMPMIPELPVAMLACTRIGAAHSVVFGGFSADALAGRIEGCELHGRHHRRRRVSQGRGRTAEAQRRRGDRPRTSSVEHCVVVRRTGGDVDWDDGRDHWYHDLVEGQATTADPEPMDSEDLLYLLYTSGTTAKPGIMHAPVALPRRRVRDPSIHLRPPPRERRLLVHGRHRLGHRPLVHRVRAAGEQGDRGHLRGRHRLPGQGPMGTDCLKYRATILYTAPTAIRALMKYGHEEFAGGSLSSLRLLGSVEEPINPEAWAWYWKYIGGERCPVVDTWWQTETGMIMITPLPGIDPQARERHLPVPRRQGRRRRRGGQLGPAGLRRLSRPRAAVAGDAARHLRGPGSLPADVLVALPGPVLPGDGCKRDDEAITGSSDAWTMS